MVLVSVVGALAPALADACPACATRDAAGGSTYALIAGMILVPYAVSIVAIKVVRRLNSDRHDAGPG
jgi:hypothetical protein